MTAPRSLAGVSSASGTEGRPSQVLQQTGPLTVSPSDVTSSVTVNGTTTGSVSVAGLPVTINPGSSKRLKAVWSYDSALVGGETVVFNACVNVTGDIDTTNDCGSATATAK